MNILFISHWFPPSNVIGSVRPYQMAKYLGALGHSVQVISTSSRSAPQNLDVDLEGLDVKSLRVSDFLAYLDSPNNNFAMKALRRIFYPDQYILTRGDVCSAGCKAFDGEVNIVFSSGLPFSTHVIARDVAQRLKVPWIADNRDLWSDTPYRRNFLGSKYFDLRYEHNILKDAKACIVIGSGMKDLLQKRLPSMDVRVMLNGADSPPREFMYSDYSSESVSIVYSGTLYKGRRDLTPLFEALNGTRLKLSVDFYGAESDYVSDLAKRYTSHPVNDCGRVSKSEIKKIQSAAGFLVLALGTDDFEKTVLTGKFFEYIETCRPVIALCDEDSELAILVNKYGLGYAGRNPGKIREFIEKIILSNSWLGRTPLELTRRHQLESVIPGLLVDCIRA